MSVAEVSELDEAYIEKRTCACSTALTANLGATMKPFGTTTDLVHALFLNLYTTKRACNETQLDAALGRAHTSTRFCAFCGSNLAGA